MLRVGLIGVQGSAVAKLPCKQWFHTVGVGPSHVTIVRCIIMTADCDWSAPRVEGLPGRMPISSVKGLPSRVRNVASPLLSASQGSKHGRTADDSTHANAHCMLDDMMKAQATPRTRHCHRERQRQRRDVCAEGQLDLVASAGLGCKGGPHACTAGGLAAAGDDALGVEPFRWRRPVHTPAANETIYWYSW
jgi:hypothetical protein